MKMPTIAVIVLVPLFALSFTASAQNQARGHRVVTRTRLQVLFSDLESQWLKAVQEKDEASLNRLLADDFQVWTPQPPGDPIPREDWLRQAFANKLQSFRLRQMAVRSLSPEVSVADFLLTLTYDRAGKIQTQDHFVVDVWTDVQTDVQTKNGESDNWRCVARYVSVVSRVPRISRTQKNMKPIGKE
jgi:hypothetical protein